MLYGQAVARFEPCQAAAAETRAAFDLPQCAAEEGEAG
jgi:hypothetical protein